MVTLQLNNAPPQLVIEGNVTDGLQPDTVKIMRSVNFYADNTFPMVSGASVTISDNTGVTDHLTETSPGVYITSTLQGKPGNTYNLSVVVNDTTYSASSTMPLLVPLDSITFRSSNRFNRSQINAVANFQDPPGVKNYYRFQEYINGTPFTKDIFVFDDRLSDGKYIQYELDMDSIYLYVGDQLKVDMYCVEKNDYDYFFQLLRSSGTGTFNTNASPANPSTNISNGAYGYFSAHTDRSKTVAVY
ncbi:hypothetical protein GCM10011511_22290 [Puia dinghuensis]|uniref:DUF4249 domain-containing protein n=1 Tax=Puia dinghuensis TaxID=1792502 RepID=A0A8J2UCY4_9BACT|nr:hypothetical protein GCM10011511_22290 [Puia dinghuensis]